MGKGLKEKMLFLNWDNESRLTYWKRGFNGIDDVVGFLGHCRL